MTDLHTHILPGMDDGAATVEISLKMLQAEREQGVETVGLTPHFYGERESVEGFLTRRAAAARQLLAAAEQLPPEKQQTLPRSILGAEVLWTPKILSWKGLEKLCYGKTDYLLLELPFSGWNGEMFRGLYDLMTRTGLTPVIAHIDRYWGIADKNRIKELLAMGMPVQLSAEALLHLATRGKALGLLRRGKAHMLISDAHDLQRRRVNMESAMKVAVQKLPREVYEDLCTFDL